MSKDIEREMLKESEIRYRSLFNNINNAVVIYDVYKDGEDFVIKDVNPLFEIIEGLKKEDVIGKKVTEVFPGVIKFGLFKIFQEVYKTGNSVHFPVSFYEDNRIKGWRENFIYKLPPKEIVAIYEDITEKKMIEENLVQSEELLRTIIDTVPACIYLKDSESRYLVVNEQTAMVYGLEQSNIIGKTDLELAETNTGRFSQAKSIMAEDREIIKSKMPKFIMEQAYTSASGKVRWFQSMKVPMVLEGNKDCVLAISVDISEKRQLEAEALRNQKLESIGILAGGIAHDFNNILTAILNNISLVKMGTKETDEKYQILVEAENASYQAKNLTQQLLTFSKGGSPLKKLVNIKQLLIDTATFALRGSNIKNEFSIAKGLWSLEIDTEQIIQVISNLIINAKQAMPTGGKVSITCENSEITKDENGIILPGRYIKIIIKDQGCGIPQEYVSKIFDPYFTTKQEGSGLGLSITYSIIKKHNGYIFLESELGKGTSFFVYLPASDKKLDENESDNGRVVQGTGRILVMDDEEVVVKVLKRIVEKLGYKMESANNGKTAIEMYKKAQEDGNKFDLVIMDLTIPDGMGGKETVLELLKIDPKAKCVVSSGYSNDPIMADFQKYGFSGVIAKPFSVGDLSKVISCVMKPDSCS